MKGKYLKILLDYRFNLDSFHINNSIRIVLDLNSVFIFGAHGYNKIGENIIII